MRDNRWPALSRRDWMRLAGAGAALGILGRDLEIDAVEAAVQARATRLPLPRGAIIRTLLKDLPPEALSSGVTLFHEHLSINIPPAPGARGGAGRQGGAPGAPSGSRTAGADRQRDTSEPELDAAGQDAAAGRVVRHFLRSPTMSK